MKYHYQSEGDPGLRWEFEFITEYGKDYVGIMAIFGPYSHAYSGRLVVNGEIIWHSVKEDRVFRLTPEAKRFVERLVKQRVFL